QQLSVFQRVSRLMVRDLSLSDVLQGIVSLVVEYTHSDSCLIYLLDGEDLVLCASNTPHPSTIGKLRLRSNEGLTGWVARERRRRDDRMDHRIDYGCARCGVTTALADAVFLRSEQNGVVATRHTDSVGQARLRHRHDTG